MPNDSSEIYLDYHATTPVDRRVISLLVDTMEHCFGNAGSVDHEAGVAAKRLVDRARRQVAGLVGCSPREVFFTSGSTESLNIAIQGFVAAADKPRITVASTQMEHKAVIRILRHLELLGRIAIHWLPHDEAGRVRIEALTPTLLAELDLIVVIGGNNEIGTINDLEGVCRCAEQAGVPVLSDTTQMIGHVPFSFASIGLSAAVISGHKLHGPRGVGALICQKGFKVRPILFGGDQEEGLRPGTINVPGVVGLGLACELRGQELAADAARVERLRAILESQLRQRFPNAIVNGCPLNRLPGNLSVAIPGVINKAVVARLRGKLAISTGAACSSGVEAPSHVLQALGLSDEMLDGAFRFGIGKWTTEAEIDAAMDMFWRACLDVEAARG